MELKCVVNSSHISSPCSTPFSMARSFSFVAVLAIVISLAEGKIVYGRKGKVVPPNYGCSSYQDCGTNEVCIGGKCVVQRPPPLKPTPNSYIPEACNCLPGYECINGECLKLVPLPPIEPPSTMPPSWQHRRPQCYDSSDCLPSYDCINGNCYKKIPTQPPKPSPYKPEPYEPLPPKPSPYEPEPYRPLPPKSYGCTSNYQCDYKNGEICVYGKCVCDTCYERKGSRCVCEYFEYSPTCFKGHLCIGTTCS